MTPGPASPTIGDVSNRQGCGMTNDDFHGVRDMTDEELELDALGHITDQGKVAAARAELKRRDRVNERDLFNAQSRERVHAQRFQAAQTEKQLEVASKQLEVADQQATSARRAMWAAWASAVVAICLLILTATQIFSS